MIPRSILGWDGVGIWHMMEGRSSVGQGPTATYSNGGKAEPKAGGVEEDGAPEKEAKKEVSQE